MSTGVLIYFYDLSELIEKFKSINMDKDDIFKLMDSGKLPYESGIVENSSNCFWFYTREVDYYIKFHTDNFLYKHNYPYPEIVMGKYTIYGAAKQLNINPHFVHGLLEDGVLKSAYLSKKNRDKLLHNSSLQLITSASVKRYEKKLSKSMSVKITCHSCGSLNCKIKYCRPFMCNTEGEYHFTCKDCKKDFYAGRKKFKDMKEYDYE